LGGENGPYVDFHEAAEGIQDQVTLLRGFEWSREVFEAMPFTREAVAGRAGMA
jgi:hypothetical protein